MLLLALMGGLLDNPPVHDPLVPPTRVTTSFACHGTTRTITIARGIGRDAVVALTVNGKPLVGTAMSENWVPLASMTTAIRPTEVSNGPCATEPPLRVTVASAASVSATEK